MIGLDELVALHKDDFPAKPLFTAYAAAIPVYRVRAGLLVTEAVDLDPIDLFLLEAIRTGVQSPTGLASFFGLEQEIVDYSIGEMLHNGWLTSSTPEVGQIRLTVLPKGQEVLAEKCAKVDVIHETEVWVDGLAKICEVRLPKQRLLRPIDAKRQGLHRLPVVVPAPKQASDLDFSQLERSVAQSGAQLWPGVQMALLLDVLTITGRGTGYRPIDVLVFQNNETFDIDFEVYDRGARRDDYERELRRLALQQSREVVPTDTPPSTEELAAFEKERARVLSIAAAPSDGMPNVEPSAPIVAVALEPTQTLEGAPMAGPTVREAEPGPGDTRERLRGELADKEFALRERDAALQAKEAALRDRDALLDAQARILEQQRVLRNQENRLAWKRVLREEARRYVVMEFPWISREAIDDEMLQCFETALRRQVKLWIAWGLDEDGPAGGRPADPAVLSAVTDLQKRFGVHSIRMQRRGNTHRKVLLWDGRAYIMGSFNWGSFRGDPRRRVREEVGTQVASPREVADLENEYKKIFTVHDLA